MRKENIPPVARFEPEEPLVAPKAAEKKQEPWIKEPPKVEEKIQIEVIPEEHKFTWKGVDYDLRLYTEYRYLENADKRLIHSWFEGVTVDGDGKRSVLRVDVPVESVSEAQRIEKEVNPYWGRR